MTWRELIKQLKKYPDEVLDMDAYVWIYDDVKYPTGDVPIVSVSPYDDDMPAGPDNELSINLSERDAKDLFDRDLYDVVDGCAKPYEERNAKDFFDRDLYDVVDGHIELYGWMEEREPDMEGFSEDERRITLVTGDWPAVYEPSGMNMVDWALPYQQYNDDMHEDEACNLILEWGGTHLPLANVTKSTADGRYWCFFNEE